MLVPIIYEHPTLMGSDTCPSVGALDVVTGYKRRIVCAQSEGHGKRNRHTRKTATMGQRLSYSISMWEGERQLVSNKPLS